MSKRRREQDLLDDRRPSKRSKRSEDETIMGYSNESNPFGDSNLTSRFVWKKKKEYEKDGEDLDKKKKKKSKRKEEKARLKGIKKELEKAKLRREERERERRQWEEEMSVLDRERNKQSSDDWESRELSFHLIQAKKRSEIRIKEGRAKSIDWLYQWVMLGYSSESSKLLVHEQQKSYPLYNPCELISDLTLEELRELKDDIKIILSSQNDFSSAYKTLLTLCEYEIEKKKGGPNYEETLDELGVSELFKDKTASEMDELQSEVRGILNAGGAVDVAYWETILKASVIFKAKATLSEMHKEIVEKREELFGDISDIKIRRDSEIVTTNTSGSKLSTEDVMRKQESEKGLDVNEEEFDAEVDLTEQKYAWNDLYRPRKPKYYNRIKTGFEWNKYNQTHYDEDNPPPKIIQGYKFNIFYPDLIDKSKTPTFHVDKSNEDTTTIRFHAGPPYEDIAFRIVNKDWESSHRKGYKCVFDKGILQLWFNFKRYRCRR